MMKSQYRLEPVLTPKPKDSIGNFPKRKKKAAKEVKPLFIPLKTEYFRAFESGEKREELRIYGPRWNDKTCTVGRAVTLSHGYGLKKRMSGTIWKFKRQYGTTFGSTYQDAILKCFGTLDIWIACIGIEVHKMVKNESEGLQR